MPSLREAQLRHAIHFSQRATFVGESMSRDPALVEYEDSNFRAAVKYCQETLNYGLLLKFTKALGKYWSNSGSADILEVCIQSLLQGDLENDIERADALDLLAAIKETQGNYSEAQLTAELEISILDRLDQKDFTRLERALRQVLRLAQQRKDDGGTEFYLNRLYQIADRQRNYKEQVNILLSLVELFRKRNEFDRAELGCEEALKIARRIGYRTGEIDVIRRLASIRRDQHLNKESQDYYQEALALSIIVGDEQRADEIREQLSILGAAMGRHIFISYNHHDRNFVERLASDLKKLGFSVWWDEWEIKVGDSIIQKVGDGIRQSAFLAVVLSPHSIESPWVQREVGSALMKQLSQDRGITVLPLLLADCEIPVLLQEIKYADFREDYRTAFDRLLIALV